DYVVHIAHGIARFCGMRMLPKTSSVLRAESYGEENPDPTSKDEGRRTNDAEEENLVLEFRDSVFLYVPASRIDLVQTSVGGPQADPELSKLGGTSWGRRKDKVEEAVRDMAAEMIQIQAVRQSVPGFAFPGDSDWQKEFEEAFPYQETPDQLS